MPNGKPVTIAIAADTRDFKTGIDAAERGLSDLGDTAKREGGKVGSAMEGIGEHADNVASASSQAAGGLGDLGGALSLLPGPLGALGTGMEVTAPAIMGLTGASDLLNLATTKFPGLAKVAAGGARGLGVAMRFATGPVGLLIAGTALLVTGLVLAYKKSETFRAIVNAAFGAVKTAAVAVGNAFKTVWDNVSKWLGKAWDYISGLPGKIKGAFTGIWGGIADGLKSAINSVLHLPLTIPTIDTHIPGVGKVGGQTLIPALAKGGIVTGPTIALIGEAGPEAVVPLNGRYGMGGNVYNINVALSAPVGSSPADIGRELTTYLDAWSRVGGRSTR